VTDLKVATAHELVWDPQPLLPSQRAGQACVVCGKVWPRPRHRVGVHGERSDPAMALFDVVVDADDLGQPGSPVYACDDDAPLLQANPQH
jgi:hypothetical protein